MSINYPALAAELLAGHPVTGAYDANDQLAADELNLANITVTNIATGKDCDAATDITEFNLLSDAERSQWIQLCGWDTVDMNGGVALATAQGIWAGAAGTITRPALIALQDKLVSRWSQLGFGKPLVLDEWIAYARNL